MAVGKSWVALTENMGKRIARYDAFHSGAVGKYLSEVGEPLHYPQIPSLVNKVPITNNVV